MIRLQPGVRAAASVLAAILFAGCPGSSSGPGPDAACGGVEVSGRVVDFESCFTSAGCKGADKTRVMLFTDSTIVSAPTAPSGSFALCNVPKGAHHLVVTDSGGSYLTTLQANPVTITAETFNVELYALARAGGLYDGFVKDAQVDVSTRALYLGQAYVKQGGRMKGIKLAKATSTPGAAVHYVNCNPRFATCKNQVTLSKTQTATGPFGQFLIDAGAGSGSYRVALATSLHSFADVTAPLGSGYITIGLHQGVPAGQADGGADGPVASP